MCDHKFGYAGVRYCNGSRSMPGTGATQRYYAHVYFCEKCTEEIGKPIPDPCRDGRAVWNSYQKVDFGASPGSPEVCGVPNHDRH